MNLKKACEFLKSIIPEPKYKGYSGKICIIGGSPNYTGAPYYAAISALRTGADLSHVFCHPTAASAIKTYSPELIVHSCLDNQNNFEKEAEAWFDRFTGFVIGPGLGRELAVDSSENLQFF